MTPDLTILGKVIGGGLPAAAYAGPRELMERVAPGGRRLPGGHAVGEPARHGRRPGHARRCSTPRAYERLDAHHERARRGAARGGRGRRRARAGRARPRAC